MSIMAMDIMEPKEVAQMLKVSVRTVVRLAEKGDLVAFKVGDLWRFHRGDVENFIDTQKSKRRKPDASETNL